MYLDFLVHFDTCADVVYMENFLTQYDSLHSALQMHIYTRKILTNGKFPYPMHPALTNVHK